MSKAEKKVIMFIVEGPSDEAALGTIIEEYFQENRVRFLIVHGDITSDDYISKDQIVTKINDLIDRTKTKYRYQTGDFTKIIHLTDTDGTFIDDEKVIEKEVDPIRYYIDRMETRCAKSTIARNHHKADILFKLRKTSKIKGIPYKIYFNSCNLEHVLYGKLNHFTKDEKMLMADEFAEKYEGNIRDFIQFIANPDLVVPGAYQKTWDFIEKDNHSLNRHTNMNLIFH